MTLLQISIIRNFKLRKRLQLLHDYCALKWVLVLQYKTDEIWGFPLFHWSCFCFNRWASWTDWVQRTQTTTILFVHMNASSTRATPAWCLRCWSRICMTFSSTASSARFPYDTSDPSFSRLVNDLIHVFVLYFCQTNAFVIISVGGYSLDET